MTVVAKCHRDVTIDIMKGIGILLVMVGHWCGPNWIGRFISSFHMPLFVLISGYFCTPVCGDFWDRIGKNAKRLLLPFLVTQLLLVLWGAIAAMAKHDVSYVMRPALSLLWGVVQDVDSQYGSVYIGPMWFLLALFFGKSLFEWLLGKFQDWKLVVVCTVISILAIIVKNKLLVLPWSILQGFSFLIFLAIGWLIRNHNIPRWVYAIAILCWLFSFLFSGFDMAGCIYHCYPLNVIGGCGGTICIWWLSSQIKKTGFLVKPLVWCGLYSLVILCFHNFEMFSSVTFSIAGHLHVEMEGLFMFLFRLLVTFFLVVVAIKIPDFRKIYGVS